MHIKVKRGKDIPIAGKPTGEVRDIEPPHQVALDLTPFEDLVNLNYLT